MLPPKSHLAGLVAATGFVLVPSALADDTLYHNARIWDGDAFQSGSLAVRDGVFIDPAELSADAARVDLDGAV